MKIIMKFDEEFLAKVALLSGQKNVVVNESGPDVELAERGKWILESCSIIDFAVDNSMTVNVTDEGTEFLLHGEELENFMSTYEKMIGHANRHSIDDILWALRIQDQGLVSQS